MKITLKDISLKFDNTQLFSNLNLILESNHLNCLLGRSGSGKTTILKLIAGIQKPDQGEIFFNDQSITNLSTQDRNVGWVPQQQLIFPGLNVRENIAYGLKARNIPREVTQKRINETSDLVGLTDFLDRNPQGLSGGERQRVALARALAPEPDILLLDEPFSSLDAPERDRLSLAFRKIQLETGVSTIHVTHAPREAELLSDQVFILSKGEILQSGTIAEIQSHPKFPEVAKLLNIPNFILEHPPLEINQPTIIPSSAIKLKDQNNRNFQAKVLSITSEKIFLDVENVILETDLKEVENGVKPGDIVGFDLDKSQFIQL